MNKPASQKYELSTFQCSKLEGISIFACVWDDFISPRVIPGKRSADPESRGKKFCSRMDGNSLLKK